MIQHQLRGTLQIIDGCSFSISRFDMLSGSEFVSFYGTPAPDLENMTTLGHTISSFPLNKTFSNSTLTAELLPNATWDDIGILAVWDPVTASDFGHVVLSLPVNQSDSDLNSDLSDANQTVEVQPTMFTNCLPLSERYFLFSHYNCIGKSC
jgi:Electron transfer DM13